MIPKLTLSHIFDCRPEYDQVYPPHTAKPGYMRILPAFIPFYKHFTEYFGDPASVNNRAITRNKYIAQNSQASDKS